MYRTGSFNFIKFSCITKYSFNFFNHFKMLKPSLSLFTIQKQAAGQTGWLSGLVLPLGQGMILETRD